MPHFPPLVDAKTKKVACRANAPSLQLCLNYPLTLLLFVNWLFLGLPPLLNRRALTSFPNAISAAGFPFLSSPQMGTFNLTLTVPT
jgi:hypothetical protein